MMRNIATQLSPEDPDEALRFGARLLTSKPTPPSGIDYGNTDETLTRTVKA
jgi:hypothetical protein